MLGLPLSDDAQQPFGTELSPRCVGKPGRSGLLARSSAYRASEILIERNSQAGDTHAAILLRYERPSSGEKDARLKVEAQIRRRLVAGVVRGGHVLVQKRANSTREDGAGDRSHVPRLLPRAIDLVLPLGETSDSAVPPSNRHRFQLRAAALRRNDRNQVEVEIEHQI